MNSHECSEGFRCISVIYVFTVLISTICVPLQPTIYYYLLVYYYHALAARLVQHSILMSSPLADVEDV